MSVVEFVSKFVPIGLTWLVYSQDIQIESNCNAIGFRNQGTTTVTLNNRLILLPGQSWSFNGNPGEVLSYQFNAVFTGAGTNNLLVTWKTP